MINGSLLEEDFLHAHLLTRSKYVKWMFLVLGAIALVGGAIWLRSGHWMGFLLFCSALGGFLGELVLRHIILPWRLRRLYHQHAAYREPFTYSWDQDTLTAESAVGHARRPWSHYRRWQESERIYLLYHSDTMFEAIPKHWFTSPEQLTEFRSVVSRIGT